MSAVLEIPYVPTPTVSARPAPESEPPYEDGPDTLLDLDHLDPGTDLGRPVTLRLVTGAAGVVRVAFDPVRTPRDQLEDPAPRAAVLARAILESLAGDRPIAQLARWLTPDVLDLLPPLIAAHRHRPWAATLRRVLVAEPTPGIAEVTAIIQRGPRTGALALRLEGMDGRWLVTALQLG